MDNIISDSKQLGFHGQLIGKTNIIAFSIIYNRIDSQKLIMPITLNDLIIKEIDVDDRELKTLESLPGHLAMTHYYTRQGAL